jgi:hypothetical protein
MARTKRTARKMAGPPLRVHSLVDQDLYKKTKAKIQKAQRQHGARLDLTEAIRLEQMTGILNLLYAHNEGKELAREIQQSILRQIEDIVKQD